MNYSLLTQIILNVLGGLGVFLLGMKNMSEGMQAVAGSRLRKLICAVTDNRILAVLVGMFVTCVIQSSSVTSVMVVGLVNSGFMTLVQAIGVIFGANIGTTITGWILTLKIGKYGLPILGIAAIFFLFSKKDRMRYTAMTIMGIGMIFFGLELMKNGFKPLRAEPAFVEWFSSFRATSYFGVLKCAGVGCLLTMIVQSSSATLGITMGLASMGIIGFETAAALVLGENIGTTITAYLASLGASTNAKRAAYAHIIFNVIGVIWITAIFQPYIHLIRSVLSISPETVVMSEGVKTFPHIYAGIALVHSGFNITNAIIFLPFVRIMARFITRLVPEKHTREIPHLTYLDVRMLNTPALGIAQSGKQIVFMGESVHKMMHMLEGVLSSEKIDEDKERKIFHREEILDNVQKEITVFLSQLVAGQIAHEESIETQRQLRMADEYESLSDYIADVLKMFIKLRKNGLTLSTAGREELLDLHRAVSEYVDMVNLGVKDENPGILSRAYTDGEQIKALAKEYRKRHLVRFSEQKLNPYKSLVFTDMLHAYRRMKDHAVNIAEALAGEK